MQAITMDEGEADVFARAALTIKYDNPAKPAPITESQILMPRRFDDRRPDLWSVFNRTQENLTKGELHGRSANGRRQQTRPVEGLDSDIRLNRALWTLAEGLRQVARKSDEWRQSESGRVEPGGRPRHKNKNRKQV